MNNYIQSYCHIRGEEVYVDGIPLALTAEQKEGRFLTALYRTLQIDYPKFFKMDQLSKLGFLAAELLLRNEADRFTPHLDRAIICFNSSSSLDADRQFQATIQEEENFFPSPSLFVYTLPNIVTAEIAIRNKIQGETAFYIAERFDAEQIFRTTDNLLREGEMHSVLVGWVEVSLEKPEAFMLLVSTEGEESKAFSAEKVDQLYRP